MSLLGSLIIFSLVIHEIVSIDCDKSDIVNDPNGILKPEGATIPDGSSVTLQCTTAGYQPADGDRKHSQCSKGVWTQTLSTCKPAKCPKRLTSPPMDHGTYKYKNDSGADAVENGTLATVECDKGYRMMKKTASGVYKQTAFKDSDAYFCHYRVWVGRKATDLGYRCDPMGKVLLIGAKFGDGSTVMELYDTEHPENSALVNEPLVADRKYHVSGLFDDGLVAIAGGAKYDTPTRDTDLYNPKLGTFVTGPQLAVPRQYAGSTMVNNEMIVCGGYGGTGGIKYSTCEKLFYDEATEAYKWITLTATMKEARYNHGMTKFNNDLFVFGGSGTATAERYVKADDTWNFIISMPTHRLALAAATLSGIIYACGGTPSPNTICEKYDPVAENWLGSTSPMNTGGYGLNLVAMEKEGKLYGFTAAGTSGTTDVELLDPTTGVWTTLTTHMMETRRYAEAVQLKPN